MHGWKKFKVSFSLNKICLQKNSKSNSNNVTNNKKQHPDYAV